MSKQEPTQKEAETMETVECDGFCEREVFEKATVDVAAGAIVGKWDDPEPHIGVAGVESDSPAVEKWCLSCAEKQFGVCKTAHTKRIESVNRYITARTVGSFLLGITTTIVLTVLI